jgi:inorganic phosphate transporter, PiT family
MIVLLFLATCFLAYANGANDNFKGVASLFGSRITGYRTAISWATLTTGAGSIAAIFLAESLLKKFSGKGLVPDAFTTQPEFLLAVGIAAGVTVILATWLGFPISTTHGLTGALVGAGVVTGVGNVNFAGLGRNFVTPLLLAPVMAVVIGIAIYGVLRALRLSLGIGKEMCLCVGTETEVIAVPRPNGVFAAEALPKVTVRAGEPAICQ